MNLLAVVEFLALLHAVGNGALASLGGLREGGRATEGAGSSTVADTDDTDVINTGNGGVAGHAGRHLDLEGEVSLGGEGQTLEAKAGNVLSDLSGLESIGVGAARGAIDSGLHGAGTVLVDLTEGHCDCAVISAGGEARGGTLARSGGNRGLVRKICLGAAVPTSQTTNQITEETTDPGLVVTAVVIRELDIVFNTDGGGSAVVLRSSATTHEVGNHGLSGNGAIALGAAQGADLARLDLAVPDDGSVGLGAAAIGGAVAGSAISDGQTRHGDTVGALNGSDNTVSRGVGHKGGDGDLRVTHFDWGFVCVERRKDCELSSQGEIKT